MNKKQMTGSLGERLARQYLVDRGFIILATNYRAPDGEIDIIARDQDDLVFVEVRAKRNLSFGSPEESVTPVKQQKLIATAQHYIQNHALETVSWRIDFVAIELDRKNNPTRLELIRNAVTQEE